MVFEPLHELIDRKFITIRTNYSAPWRRFFGALCAFFSIQTAMERPTAIQAGGNGIFFNNIGLERGQLRPTGAAQIEAEIRFLVTKTTIMRISSNKMPNPIACYRPSLPIFHRFFPYLPFPWHQDSLHFNHAKRL